MGNDIADGAGQYAIPRAAATALAAKYGCEWGGNWSGGFHDNMHFEIHLSPAQAVAVQPVTPPAPKDAPMSKAEVATIQAQIHALNVQLSERIERVHAGVTLTVHGDKTHVNGQDQIGPIIRQLAADVAALKAAQAPPVPPVTPAKK